MFMKKTIGRFLHGVLPRKWYKLIANRPLLVPYYYVSILHELEHYSDISLTDSAEKNLLLMRKYAHIIDKGLQRKRVEAGHSKQVYEDLKAILRDLSPELAEEPTVQWAKKQVARYDALQEDKFQIERKTPAAPKVSYNDFCELMRNRRSNRYFSERRLSPEDVSKLTATVSWAASSCNKQPIKLFYSFAPAVARKCLRCCKGGTGFDGEIPSFWVFTADCRGYVWPSELYLPHIDVSLGAQNFFLAATTLGLSGTILSWAQHTQEEEQTLRELLEIPPEYLIVFCAVVGYAKYQYDAPARKN